MFGLRDDLRCETQQAYGGYCSYARHRKAVPVSYTQFKTFHEFGMRTSEIFELLHSHTSEKSLFAWSK